MKSFLDRADRELLLSSRCASSCRKNSNSNPAAVAGDDDETAKAAISEAYSLLYHGKIDESCDAYRRIYEDFVAKSPQLENPGNNVNNKNRHAGQIDEQEKQHDNIQRHLRDAIDVATSDYGQVLEICCRYETAVTVLQSTIDKYNLHFPSLSSLLLVKLLYIRPDKPFVKERLEELKNLVEVIQDYDEPMRNKRNNKKKGDIGAICVDITAHDKAQLQTFKTTYKSHWAYYIMVRELLLRERRFPAGVQMKLQVQEQLEGDENNTDAESLYVIGDSHVVPLGHREVTLTVTVQEVKRKRKLRLIPWVVTGLKAAHISRGDGYFIGSNFQRVISSIIVADHMKTKEIIVSAGEIDCREGLLNAVNRKLYPDLETAIDQTLRLYLQGLCRAILQALNTKQEKQTKAASIKQNDSHNMSHSSNVYSEPSLERIYVLPVVPYRRRQKRGGKVQGRELRNRTIKMWNAKLKQILCCTNGYCTINDFLGDQNKGNVGQVQQQHNHPVVSIVYLDLKNIFERHYQNSDILEKQKMISEAENSDDYYLEPKFSLDGTHASPHLVQSLQNALQEHKT